MSVLREKNPVSISRTLKYLSSLILFFLLAYTSPARAQFTWSTGGVEYATRAEAESALRNHPQYQWAPLLEPFYTEQQWNEPVRTIHWYSVLDYQQVSSSELHGYSLSSDCGFFDGTDCHATIQDAVNASYPQSSICDVKYSIFEEFTYSDAQWEEVLEHGIAFWALERAPIKLDLYYWSADGQSCNFSSSFNRSIYRTWFASCDTDLKPAKGDLYNWSNAPAYPNVCSTNGREPPQSNLALISHRTSAVCTTTEGNPCSPMTGNKLLSETDYTGNLLSIERHYHSSLESSPGSMGAGWSHNYSSVLLPGKNYTLIGPDGTWERFSPTQAGDYRSIIKPGTLLTLSDEGAQVNFDDGRIEVYERIVPLTSETAQYRLIESYSPNLYDRPLRLTYDDRSLLIGVIDQQGRQLVFEYDENLRISTIILPDSQLLTYEYDPAGNLSRVSYQDGSQRLYHYENPALPNHLTGITDENGQRHANYEYDDHARVILSEHANGAGRVDLQYSEPGDTKVTLPSGDVRRYQFDPNRAAFEVSQISDGRGNMSFARNDYGWIESQTDPVGKVTQFSYDDYHMISETEAAGSDIQSTRRFSWDIAINRLNMIDEPGAVTLYEYDSAGRISSKLVRGKATGSERAWLFTYYSDTASQALSGRLSSIDGPRADVNDITRFEYYSDDEPLGRWRAGDLRTVINALGQITEILEYDAHGRPLAVRDPRQIVTRLTYHPRGWLRSQTVEGKTTRFNYDPAGNLTHIEEPDGSIVGYEYDQAHRLIAASDHLGNRIEYSLDASGRRTGEYTYDSAGVLRHRLTRSYDSLGRMISTVRGQDDEDRFDYDAVGNKISSKDANLAETVYRYDALSRPVAVINAGLGETRLQYDDRNNLSQVTDPNGAVTDYHYDGLENLVEIISPDSGRTRHEYDQAGNRLSTTDGAGRVTRYEYDALNRLTGIRHGDPILDIEFTYDEGVYGSGRLTKISDATGMTNFVYDGSGNMVSEIQTIGDAAFVVSYAYNAAGKLQRVIYPSGMQIDYELDAAGRITSILQTIDGETATLASNISREPFGPIRDFNYGNGLSFRMMHDLAYKPRSIQSGESLNLALESDAAGNLLTLRNRLDGLPVSEFEYDNLYRLTAARGEFGHEEFRYDANGNRSSAVIEGSQLEYLYEPGTNRLVTQNGLSLTRDAVGNRSDWTDKRGHGLYYTYGDDNRLSRIERKDAAGERTIASFQYDGRGQRAIKASDSGKTYFVYGLSGELIGEYNQENTGAWTEYVYLQGFPLAAVTRSLKVINPPGEVLILDDGDGGTSSSGSWRGRTSDESYQGDHLYAAKSAGARYRWQAYPPGEQNHVFAWWPDRNNLSDSVEYTIGYGAGLSRVEVRNQKVGGGQWQFLGTFERSDGLNFIEASSRKNRFVADAVRWVQVTEPVLEWSVKSAFIHFDHLGAPFSMTDENQTEVWRWSTSPFGNTLPEQDPDGDGEEHVLNLRYPGQYFDAESGLIYNYFRYYDPEAGRYIESDPIGLRGGLNPFVYALNAPTQFIDPKGLQVSGRWIKPPRFNVFDYGLTGAEFVTPHLSEWAYLKVFRIHGFANGFVNVDVHCRETTDCLRREWEIHERIGVSYSGHVDVGPNMAAAAIGSMATPAAGVAAGVVTLGGSAMSSLLFFLREVQARGGDKIRWLYDFGPTALCLGTRE
jgi:RHS repeat-associated protein